MNKIFQTHSFPAWSFLLSLFLALTLFSFGCATSSDKKAEAPAGEGSQTASEFSDAGATVANKSEPASTLGKTELRRWRNPGMVHFNFDKSEILPAGVPVLQNTAQQLLTLDLKVLISGYTDNRGSEEYNLALGERRAAATRRYLADLGVPMKKMGIVSYGELRPLRTDNNEAAWAENRRAEFKPSN